MTMFCDHMTLKLTQVPVDMGAYKVNHPKASKDHAT